MAFSQTIAKGSLNAGENVIIQGSADWLFVRGLSFFTPTITFDTDGPFQITPREFIPVGFTQSMQITAPSSAPFPVDYDLIYGSGPAPTFPSDRRQEINSFGSVTDVSVPAGQQMLLTSATAGQVALWACVPDGAANGVRVGNALVAANRGLYLAPGRPFRIPTYAINLYAFNPGAAAVAVSLGYESAV